MQNHRLAGICILAICIACAWFGWAFAISAEDAAFHVNRIARPAFKEVFGSHFRSFLLTPSHPEEPLRAWKLAVDLVDGQPNGDPDLIMKVVRFVVTMSRHPDTPIYAESIGIRVVNQTGSMRATLFIPAPCGGPLQDYVLGMETPKPLPTAQRLALLGWFHGWRMARGDSTWTAFDKFPVQSSDKPSGSASAPATLKCDSLAAFSEAGAMNLLSMALQGDARAIAVALDHSEIIHLYEGCPISVLHRSQDFARVRVTGSPAEVWVLRNAVPDQ